MVNITPKIALKITMHPDTSRNGVHFLNDGNQKDNQGPLRIGLKHS